RGKKKRQARLHSLPRCGSCSKERRQHSHSLLVLLLLIAPLIAATLTHSPSLSSLPYSLLPPHFQKRQREREQYMSVQL
ncbi:MAG: hypothetical protein J3Q66DRAFT_360247, partial [Benniella sp.]